MKKLFLFAAVALLGFAGVNAQEAAASKKVSFGVKAGVNFASITGDGTSELDARTSFHVGGVAEIMISDKFSFQPELLYSDQGAKYVEDNAFFKGEATSKLAYINVPLMAKYYVVEGLSIEAGPQVGFLISAEEEYTFTDKTDSANNESGTDDFKSDASSIDFGLNFGLGYKMESGLNFDARYNLGLSNINDYEGASKNQNSVIQLSVGFMF